MYGGAERLKKIELIAAVHHISLEYIVLAIPQCKGRIAVKRIRVKAKLKPRLRLSLEQITNWYRQQPLPLVAVEEHLSVTSIPEPL